jgi:hypothetical protein
LGVTSLAKLGVAIAPEEWDEALRGTSAAFLAALSDGVT